MFLGAFPPATFIKSNDTTPTKRIRRKTSLGFYYLVCAHRCRQLHHWGYWVLGCWCKQDNQWLEISHRHPLCKHNIDVICKLTNVIYKIYAYHLVETGKYGIYWSNAIYCFITSTAPLFLKEQQVFIRIRKWCELLVHINNMTFLGCCMFMGIKVRENFLENMKFYFLKIYTKDLWEYCSD